MPARLLPIFSHHSLGSSYYDSPVTVDIKRCEEVEPSVYDREVALSVLGREFCVAKSLVVRINGFWDVDQTDGRKTKGGDGGRRSDRACWWW